MPRLSDARILAQAGGNIVPSQPAPPREFDHGAHIRELKRAAKSAPMTIRTNAAGKRRAE